MSSYPEPEPEPSLQAPPPSYSEVIGELESPIRPPSEKQPLDLEEDGFQENDEEASSSHPPPPFSVTPGSLILAPQSVLIQSPVSGARPLYQLFRPLNGHITTTGVIDVATTRLLKEDGTLRTIRERDRLYDIAQARWPMKGHAHRVVVSSQRRVQFDRVLLRKNTAIGLTGHKDSFDALSADEDEHPRILFRADQKKGVLQWHDGGGTLVAVETLVGDPQADEQRLDILVSLDKPHLDLVVALWVARIYQDTQEQGIKEDRYDEMQRRKEQKQHEKGKGKGKGKQQNVLEDVKDALGLTYVRKQKDMISHGMLFTGPPALKENGRINWGGN